MKHETQNTKHEIRTPASASPRSGLTLIELMVVTAIVSMVLAVSYPSFTRGLDTIRLHTTIDRAGTFFNRARIAADRLQQPIQLLVDTEKHELNAVSLDGKWEKTLSFPASIEVGFPAETSGVMLYPASPPPEFRLLLKAASGADAGMRINVFKALPEVWDGK